MYDNSSVENVWGVFRGFIPCSLEILQKLFVKHPEKTVGWSFTCKSEYFSFFIFQNFFFLITQSEIFLSTIKTFRSVINSPSISHSIHTTAYNLLLYRDYHIRQLFLQGTIPFINVDNKIVILLVYINSHDLVHHNIYSRLNKQSLGEQYVDKTESLYYLESSLINKLISIRIMIDGYFNLSLSFRLDLGSISELQKTMWSTAIRWSLCNEIV